MAQATAQATSSTPQLDPQLLELLRQRMAAMPPAEGVEPTSGGGGGSLPVGYQRTPATAPAAGNPVGEVPFLDRLRARGFSPAPVPPAGTNPLSGIRQAIQQRTGAMRQSQPPDLSGVNLPGLVQRVRGMPQQLDQARQTATRTREQAPAPAGGTTDENYAGPGDEYNEQPRRAGGGPITDFTAEDNLRATQINPFANDRQQRYGSAADAAAQALMGGPNRAETAADALSLMEERSRPEYERQLQDVGRRAASLGRIGAGMTTSELGDVQMNRERELSLARRELSNQSADQELNDRLTRAGFGQQAEQRLADEGFRGRQEIRGERGYQNEMANSATDRRVQQLMLEQELADSGENRELRRAGLQAEVGNMNSPAPWWLQGARDMYGEGTDQQMAAAGQAAQTAADREESDWAIPPELIPRPQPQNSPLSPGYQPNVNPIGGSSSSQPVTTPPITPLQTRSSTRAPSVLGPAVDPNFSMGTMPVSQMMPTPTVPPVNPAGVRPSPTPAPAPAPTAPAQPQPRSPAAAGAQPLPGGITPVPQPSPLPAQPQPQPLSTALVRPKTTATRYTA